MGTSWISRKEGTLEKLGSGWSRKWVVGIIPLTNYVYNQAPGAKMKQLPMNAVKKNALSAALKESQDAHEKSLGGRQNL